jgi:hypothetical protein
MTRDDAIRIVADCARVDNDLELDATDAIREWREFAANTGDVGILRAIALLGIAVASDVYAAAREAPSAVKH